MNITDALAPYQKIIETELASLKYKDHISLFYDPIRYFLKIPGKRIRPLLVLLTAEALGQKATDARFAAAAVELLHNFTLVHDDIMDNDNTRRGQLTIHNKWDISTAILAGDGLMGFAFQYLLKSPSVRVADMTRRFTDTMILICEGQGLDKMFETGSRVNEAQYLEMIANKTAVLLQLSCALGALSANAAPDQIEQVEKFGYALGMGFQIQDDILDMMGESNAIGKPAGSDLSMRKQTILTIKLQDKLPEQDIYSFPLQKMREQLKKYGILEEVQQTCDRHFEEANSILQQLPKSNAQSILSQLTDFIIQRQM